MTSLPTEKLANLVTKRHQVLNQLCEVGRQQLAIADQVDVSALLQLLASKQGLIMELQHVERDLTPHRKESPEQRQWHSANDRAACAQRAHECNALLSEIIHLENQSEDRMTTRREEVATQSQQVYTSAQVRTAYAELQVPKGRLCTVPASPTASAKNPMRETLDVVSES